MGVLAPIVQVFVLPVLSCRHHRPVGNTIRSELVGDQHPRRASVPLQEFLEEPGRRLAVPLPLDQNVEHVSVLVHRPPQILLHAADLDEHFVEMPLVTWSGHLSSKPAGVLGPEPRAPGADRLVRHLDPALGHQ